jgi:hypothetical protein
MRAEFFGREATIAPMTQHLVHEPGTTFTPLSVDIRDAEGVARISGRYAQRLELIIHTVVGIGSLAWI